jgi:hypothetical protein
MSVKAFALWFCLLFFTAPQAAWGANAPHQSFDAVASEVAGKPVVVHCEDDADAWQQMVRATFEPDPRSDLVVGFTQPSRSNIVYLSPRVCLSLHDALTSGVEAAGLKPFALGLQILAHEAVHQAGVVDEAETECRSLPLVLPLAVKYFGLKEKIVQRRIVLKTRNYRVASKIIKLRVPTVVSVAVANPQVSKLQTWVNYWHMAKPANYQGGC